ncbi:mitochondrial escape protein 2 [Marasmius tenuissimus]|uniref:Mitochondrial escape protein 2 n=1 Tax=Marasmius tenuissimus TaxID=585030 RepID=A0ABR2ZPY2_9AGAR
MLARARLARLVAQNVRSFVTQTQDANAHRGAVYLDSILPIQLGRFDLRRYLGLFREDRLINSIRNRFASVNVHNVQIEEVQSHSKDGGVFVKFRYTSDDPENAVKDIEEEFRKRANEEGGILSWTGKHVGGVWLVRGRPWLEDLYRFPSNMVKVSFDGPDLHEETLYNLFRPFGRIGQITESGPVPAGTLRHSTIAFERLHSSTIARNVLHGLEYQTTASSSTKLRCVYVAPIQAHAIRDWIAKHPKIVLPVIVFLLGTLTYTIFDPIRAWMVEGKMLDWFSLQEFKIYKWLRANTLDRLYTSHATDTSSGYDGTWKERKDAEASLNAYLTDLPSTVAFIHGPQGSGKTQMVESSMKNSGRRTLVIDCRSLQRATSEKQLVDALAGQTGYWPVFSFLSSMNNLIDLASVGLIGQKAGFSSSIEEQLQKILDTVAKALKDVHHSEVKSLSKQRERDMKHSGSDSRGSEPTLEPTQEGNGDSAADVDPNNEKPHGHLEKARKKQSREEVLAVQSLPIVVIRNFAIKGGLNRDEVMDVLAKWAAKLAESQIAHVVVISDNRENSKRLAKALPSKPLNNIPVYDADPTTALEYVQKKLKDADVNVQLSREEVTYVERLGGRSSDLESLIHKVVNKQGVKESIEEIITRGVAEQRKCAFGDDSEDAKNLPWTREQAWFVLKMLSAKSEVPYHEVLLNFPFKGDETPLRSMEQAELISIGTNNGRPSVIRPGRPIYRWVFERLVDDPIFQAVQEIAYNDALIASASSTIQSCEDELLKLKEIGWRPSDLFWTNPAAKRAEYLLNKMRASGRTLESLEKKNAELKKTLSKAS